MKLSWIKRLRLKTAAVEMAPDDASVITTSSVSSNDAAPTTEKEEKEDRIPDPCAILDLAHLFWPSRTFLAAVEMELFTKLAAAPNGEMTNAEIREALGLHERATPDFADALVSIKMLQKPNNQDENPDNWVYCNTLETGLFLDKARPETYIGEVLEECSKVHYLAWDDHANFLKDRSRQVDAVKQVIKSCSTQAFVKLIKAKQLYGDQLREGERNLKADAIFEVGFGFWKSRLLLTAIEWRLFTQIEKAKNSRMTLADVRRLYGLRTATTQEFLDSLVEVKMLDKKQSKSRVDDDGDPIQYYTNTFDGSVFLDFEKPSYLGAKMELNSKETYRYWANLPEALKTGKQQTDLSHTGSDDRFPILYNEQERVENFVYAMSAGIGHGTYSIAARMMDFSKYKTLTEIGGCSGQLACYIAQKTPGLQCVTTDLPQVQLIAERMIADWGCENQVKAIVSDCFKEDFPIADCVVWGMMLHNWNLEQKKLLIRKAYDALPSEGGALYTIEFFIDDERKENFYALCMSLQLLLETGGNGGSCCTSADFRGWCLEAGFNRVEFHHVLGPLSYGIAYKG